MTQDGSRRTIEVKLDIEATPEQVWKALTDAEELARWFPLEAGVEPGAGGKIVLSWGENMEGICRIRRWEPERHLQTTWMEPTERAAAAARDAPEGSWIETAARGDWPADHLLVDTYLEARGGGTTLRLVHSGFSADAAWDEEYDSHRRGWNFELCSLRHYLERHAGKNRTMEWVRAPLTAEPATVWSRLLGADGLGAESHLDALGSGAAYSTRTVHGEMLRGTVVLSDAPLQLALTLEEKGSALLRFGIETCFGPPEANLWLSAWNANPDDMKAFHRRWETTLRELAA
ncbi:MAG: SRPBCC domain-containing protein [Acidobacteriota bacterium]